MILSISAVVISGSIASPPAFNAAALIAQAFRILSSSAAFLIWIMDTLSLQKLEKERCGSLDGTLVGDLDELAALTVEFYQRLGLLVIRFQPFQHGGRLVILADDQLAAAAVAHALFGAGFVDDMIACTALGADAAAGHPLEDRLVGHDQINDLVDLHPHLLQGFALGDGARHAVEDEPFRAVRLRQ